MPVWVMDRPPNIWAASSAVARPVNVTYLQPEKLGHCPTKSEGGGLLLEESNRSSDHLRLLVV